MLLQHLQCMLHQRLSSWTFLSSSCRELWRASSCGRVHLSRSCSELRLSITSCVCRISSLGEVHLSSTSHESCRASSRRGPHFSSSCSVRRTSSSGGARQSYASGERRHASSCSVCCFNSGAHPSGASNEPRIADTHRACRTSSRVEHGSPALAVSSAAPATVQHAPSVQHAASVWSGMLRRYSMEHQSSMEKLTRIVTALQTSRSNCRLAVHLRVQRFAEAGARGRHVEPSTSLASLERVLLRSECGRFAKLGAGLAHDAVFRC